MGRKYLELCKNFVCLIVCMATVRLLLYGYCSNYVQKCMNIIRFLDKSDSNGRELLFSENFRRKEPIDVDIALY